MSIDDKYDKSILRVIQREGRITNQELAKKVSLSTAPCWRRLNRLENDQIIQRYVALVDREKLGLSVLVYIHVSLHDHNQDEAVAEFDRFINESDNVLECYSVSGDYDYLLRVVTKDVKQLESFLMGKLLKQKAVRNANTSFVFQDKKYTTSLPL